jgi:hypothetical protein
MTRARLAAFSLIVFSSSLAAGAAGAATPAPAPPAVRILPGTYRQIDTVTKKPLALGNQIVIIAGKGGRLGFSVNAVRQSDMNQGFAVGLLPVQPPLTWSSTSSSGNCRLTFEALPKGLKLTQDAGFGDCGFGYGVSANGTYALVTEKPLKP